MSLLLDGKIVRDKIRDRLRVIVSALSQKPTLAIVQIGENEQSAAYIQQKKKFGEVIGAEVRHVKLAATASQDKIISQIQELNLDGSIHGIILQLPIPAALDKSAIMETIDPRKDVDGLTSTNIKKLWSNTKDGFVPATAMAVMTLLDYYGIQVEGKSAVVIGRSELVGKPLFLSLINKNATVTLCHSKTVDVEQKAKEADILIVAAGSAHFVGKEFVSPGQVVIDVGINVITSPGNKLQEEIGGKKLVGDVDFDAVKDIVGAISPVPGGVGPLTVASLFENLVQSANSRV